MLEIHLDRETIPVGSPLTGTVVATEEGPAPVEIVVELLCEVRFPTSPHPQPVTRIEGTFSADVPGPRQAVSFSMPAPPPYLSHESRYLTLSWKAIARPRGYRCGVDAPFRLIPASVPLPSDLPAGGLAPGYRVAARRPPRRLLGDLATPEALGQRISDEGIVRACSALIEQYRTIDGRARRKSAITDLKYTVVLAGVGLALALVYLFWGWWAWAAWQDGGSVSLLVSLPIGLVLVIALVGMLAGRRFKLFGRVRAHVQSAPRCLALAEEATFHATLRPLPAELSWQLVKTESFGYWGHWEVKATEVAAGAPDVDGAGVVVRATVPPDAAPSSASRHHRISWDLRLNAGSPQKTVHTFQFLVLPVKVAGS